jgi:magnesium transporter
MKTLTIITVIALPLTVVTSFFGMNFNEELPLWGWLLNHPTGFWVSMLFIVGTVAGLLLLFRKRRWL